MDSSRGVRRGVQRHPFLSRLGLFVVACLVGLGTLELAARLLPAPRYHREPLELDPELGFRGIPGHRASYVDDRGPFELVLNEDGFRDERLASGDSREEKGEDERRVVFIGDSFLVGLGLRESDLLPSRVASRLRADPGIAGFGPEDRVEVQNLSIIDSGTAQQLLVFRSRSRSERLAPDRVVVALYPANDVVNNSLALAGRTSVSPGDLVRPYLVLEEGRWHRRYVHPWRALLRNRSDLFAHVEHRLVTLGTRWGIEWLDPWPRRLGQIERLTRHRPPEPWLEIFTEPRPDSEWAEAWDGTFDLLRAFRSEVAEIGAELLVVVIPSQLQVERTARSVALDHQTRRVSGSALGRWLDWSLPEKRLASFFAEAGIESVFLLEPLRAAARAGASTYDLTGHLSAEGHRVAAEALLERWQQEDSAVESPAAESPAVESSTEENSAARIRAAESPGGASPEPGGARDRVDRAAATPVWTQPADRLAAAFGAQGVADFRRGAHGQILGDGWGPWQPGGDDQPAGRWMLGRALAVLPVAGESLFVRGWIPAGSGPVSLSLELPAVGRRAFHLPEPGAFSIEIPVPSDLGIPTVDGYVPFVLAPVKTGILETPILVQAIGFR